MSKTVNLFRKWPTLSRISRPANDRFLFRINKLALSSLANGRWAGPISEATRSTGLNSLLSLTASQGIVQCYLLILHIHSFENPFRKLYQPLIVHIRCTQGPHVEFIIVPGFASQKLWSPGTRFPGRILSPFAFPTFLSPKLVSLHALNISLFNNLSTGRPPELRYWVT